MSRVGGKPYVVPVYLTVLADNDQMAMLDALKLIHPLPSIGLKEVRVEEARIAEAVPEPSALDRNDMPLDPNHASPRRSS